MTHIVVPLLVIAGLAVGVPDGMAAGILLAGSESGPRLVVEGSNRTRVEFVDWFDGGDVDGRYDFVHNRFRLGLRLVADPVEAYLEYQNTVIGNVPEDAVGPGGVYFANTARHTQVGNWVRQGWVRLAHEVGACRVAASVGRQVYSDGAEIAPHDPALAWLRKARIAERLLGPFDYTAVGRSFDGVVATVDHPVFNVTGFALRPTSGGFEIDAGRHLEAIDLAGLSATLKDRPGFAGTNARLFWLYYADDRPGHDGVTVLDNRPLAARMADRTEIVISTVGGEWLHVHDVGPGRLDLLVWGAEQFGAWQALDHAAWAFAAEAGFQMPLWWAAPWLRAGVDRSSGDDDPGDGRHETFFQMLPTARLYAQTPFYDLMNDQDVFVQLLLRPLRSLAVRIDGHWLSVTERADLAYFGGGATKDDSFGYGGLPTGNHRELAYLVDVGLTWTPYEALSVSTYYGHAVGQGVIRNAFADPLLNYGYVEATVRF